jgi:hypothetical protein
MDDVAVAIIAGMSWLTVMVMLYSRVVRLLAKIGARRVTQSKEGNLSLVVWNNVHNRTERIQVNTTLPLNKDSRIIRAVRLWGIVRRKSIIEIAEQGGENRVLFKTY